MVTVLHALSYYSWVHASSKTFVYPPHEFLLNQYGLYTDKKENLIFLIYKEIQKGAVAKSYMTNGLLIYGEIFAHFLIY
jgi:hypothetical protein